jgi:unsaturated rhamnogalacturonyl hydrolase
MKRRIICGVMAIATLLPLSMSAQRNVTSPEKTLAAMRQCNQYFMDKWPDVGMRIVHEVSRASNIWTRAVYYEGLLELYAIDQNPVYLDYMVRWADFHQWDLRDGKTFTRNADNQCAGQIYLALYDLNNEQRRVEKIKASIDSMMRTDKVDDWNWIDAVQMAMPVFAKLGVMYNDPSYWERMHTMYMYTRDRHGDKGLFNPTDQLWWRDKDFDPPYKEPNGEDCYWSRGNGWVFAALVRVLSILPKDAPHRKQYEDDFVNMAKALLKAQRKDGFWNVSLHDASNFGGKETTGTSLFVYGFAWGSRNGYLNEREFAPAARKAWHGIMSHAVQSNGFLGYVQGTGKEPKDGQPVSKSSMPNFEDFGLGCFLLAGAEMWRMERGK